MGAEMSVEGKSGPIKNVSYESECVVYRRADGSFYKRVGEDRHVRVSRMNELSPWHEEGGKELFDPEERVVVVGQY